MGDCFFESALAGLADSHSGQATIRNMIKTNSDGSFTVTFPGDTSSPVHVTQKDLEKNFQNGDVVDSRAWARIVETAFLKYDRAGIYSSGKDSLGQSEGISGIANVAFTGKALHLLTGQDAATDSLGGFNLDNRELTFGSASKSDVGAALTKAFANGDPVTASASPIGTIDGHGCGPLVDGHMYTVMSYNPKSGTVVVRNPWGSNEQTPLSDSGKTVDGITAKGDGELSMSLDTFTKRFSDVNLSGTSAASNDIGNYINDSKAAVTNIGAAGSALAHGQFGKALGDLGHTLSANASQVSDVIYGVTDLGERTVKGAIANATNDVSNLAHEAVHDLNPFNW